MTTETTDRCPTCGYTKEDALIHWDHHLCKNYGNAPWEKNGTSPFVPRETDIPEFGGKKP